MTSALVLRHYIAASFRESSEFHDVSNPANGRLLARAPICSAQMLEDAISAARMAQKAWAARPAIERAHYLRRLAASWLPPC